MSSFNRTTGAERDSFALQLMRLMTRNYDAAKIAYDAPNFALSIATRSGANESFELKILFDSYKSRPPELRQAFLEDMVWSMESNGFIGAPPVAQTPDKFEDAQEYLFPRVVSKIEADWGAEQAYGPSGTDEVRTDINQKMAGELFADHLLLTLVYSHRPGHEFVMERTLEQWGVTFQQACEVAVRNLDRRTKQPFEPIADGVYTARYNDGFDASRIFLLDRFAQCQLKGDPVAVFPQRDAIVFTGSEDQAGLEMVFKLTSTVQSIGLLNSPFVLADQKWQLFRVPNTHASSETIAVSNLCDLLKIYGEQTSIIERGLKRQQMAMTPVPIATLKHDGCQHVTTVAVWTADAPNPLLLPYAEQIAFIPHGSTTFSHVADFDHVLQELPELLTALKCYPERFLVRQYPSPDQFAKLGILPDCEACEEHRQRKVKFCSRCGNRVTPQATPWPPLRHLL